MRQTLWWFLEHGLQLPVRTASSEITWRRPSYGMLYRILSSPVYGGAYAYGKSERTVHYEQGEPRVIARRKPREQWLVLIPNAHEGYVSWEEFERIQQMMAANVRGRGRVGAATRGPALLAGLLRCRRCGRRLTVWYTGATHDVLRYACHRGALDNGDPRYRTELAEWTTAGRHRGDGVPPAAFGPRPELAALPLRDFDLAHTTDRRVARFDADPAQDELASRLLSPIRLPAVERGRVCDRERPPGDSRSVGER